MTDFWSSSRPSGRISRRSVLFALLCLCGSLTLLIPAESDSRVRSKVKPSRAPRAEPELKIVDLQIAPRPYTLGNGPLQFSVTVQLPKEMRGDLILEVSSLISSPSKSSVRFLSHRQPVESSSPSEKRTERQKVSIELVWDGQDQRKQLAAVGTYSYEVRTKLLLNGEKGLRTVMVGWPKRGTLQVKWPTVGALVPTTPAPIY
ncbi:MAG: hypothetical protein KF890_06900 [Nitrospira sp.]|nr:hypothetical protein [Nitrospira sp.]